MVMKRALPPVLVPVKLVVPPFSVVTVELPAVAELLKISELLLSIAAVPVDNKKVTKPVALFVILDPFAELVSLKLTTALLTIVAVPAVLLLLNSMSPPLVMCAVPAVLVSLKLITPPLTPYVTKLVPPLAVLEFRNTMPAPTVNVWVLAELLVMPAPFTTKMSPVVIV